jgi:hypothetical protein
MIANRDQLQTSHPYSERFSSAAGVRNHSRSAVVELNGELGTAPKQQPNPTALGRVPRGRAARRTSPRWPVASIALSCLGQVALAAAIGIAGPSAASLLAVALLMLCGLALIGSEVVCLSSRRAR